MREVALYFVIHVICYIGLSVCNTQNETGEGRGVYLGGRTPARAEAKHHVINEKAKNEVERKLIVRSTGNDDVRRNSIWNEDYTASVVMTS